MSDLDIDRQQAAGIWTAFAAPIGVHLFAGPIASFLLIDDLAGYLL